jgi:hypothetical protein
MILIICAILIVIAVVVFVIGLSEDCDGAVVASAIIAVLTGIFGFGVMANCIPVSSKNEIITPVDLVKGETTIFAKVDGLTFSTTEHKFFSAEINRIKIKKVIDINSYGSDMIVDSTSPRYEWFIEGNLEKAE